VILNLKGHTDSVESCAFSPDGSRIALGDMAGQFLMLSLKNVEISVPFVTPVRMLLFENRIGKAYWDKNIRGICRWCGRRFNVSDRVIEIIDTIHRKARLSPEQSPVLELPIESWDEPGLFFDCPLCSKPMRCNPFIVDNAEMKR
jgi:hypothetical protein